MGVKLLCKYCSVFFFVVAGCFCGSKFQWCQKRRSGLFGLTVLEERLSAVVERIVGNGCTLASSTSNSDAY